MTLPVLSANRDLRIGRLQLVTATNNIGEAVGEDITAEETGIAVARHRPKKFSLIFPLYGSSFDSNPYAAGQRMRQQMRAILENTFYRQQGLYFIFLPDPELDGWMMFGSGTITYTDGGLAMGQFQIEFDTAFRIGSQRTDREARRVELYDRTLVTVPHDYRGLVFGADFVGLRTTPGGYTPYGLNTNASGAPAPTIALPLPVNVQDPLAAYRTPAYPGARAGIDGSGGIVSQLQHGNVISFEQSESDMGKGSVVVWDRQGYTAPAQTLAGDTDPQSTVSGYGWWEVYGPNQPLTASDAPVMANGLCRVRYVAATNSWAVDVYVAGTGYVEQGRVTVWDGTAPADTYTFQGVAIPQNNGAYASVMEYTQERAVLRFSTYRNATYPDIRVDTYITLQRGWTGPRFESYLGINARLGQTQAGVHLRYVQNSTANLLRAGAGQMDSGGGSPVAAGDDTNWGWGTATGNTFSNISEPWAFVQNSPSSATALGVTVSTTQSLARLFATTDTTAYGSTRYAIGVTARYGENQAPTGTIYGYCNMALGFARPGSIGVFEAETYMNPGGTRTSVADAAASGGNAINDTQTAQTQSTVLLTTPTDMPFGVYGVFVRVRVTTAGDTLTVDGGFIGGSNTSTGTVTTMASTYVWLYCGDATFLTQQANNLFVNIWRSAGTGTTGVRLDRVVLVPMYRNSQQGGTLWDGARDVAGLHLWDARMVPEYVER